MVLERRSDNVKKQSEVINTWDCFAEIFHFAQQNRKKKPKSFNIPEIDHFETESQVWKVMYNFNSFKTTPSKKGTISIRVHSGLALVMEITTYNTRQPGGSYSKGNYNSLIFGYSRARLISADGNTKRKKNQNSITSWSKWPDENDTNLLISTRLKIWRFSGQQHTSIETVQTCDGIRM